MTPGFLISAFEWVSLAMPGLFIVVFGLIAWGAPKWRMTAVVILGAAIFNLAMMPLYFQVQNHEDAGVLLPSISAAIDFLTATLVLSWGSKGATRQAAALCFAMIAHVTLIISHIKEVEEWAAGVYDLGIVDVSYALSIFTINVIQILIMRGSRSELIGTISKHLGNAYSRLSSADSFHMGSDRSGNPNHKKIHKMERREGRI